MRRPQDYIGKLKSLLKIATLRSTDDSGGFRFGQIGALGKTQTANIFTPYGFIHHPPSGSLGVVLIMQGEESKSIAICDDPKRRIKGLKEGEVGVANYLTQTHFIMKENGDWDIQVVGNVNMVVTGDVNVSASGKITMTSPVEIFLNAPVVKTPGVTIDNNGVTVNTGDVNVTSGDVISETISLQNHVHSDVMAGGDNTGVPVP